VCGALPAVELGKRIILGLERVGHIGWIVRWVYLVLLFGSGLYIAWESLHVTESVDAELGYGSPLSSREQSVYLPPRVVLVVSKISCISVWVLLGIGLGIGLLSDLLGVGGGFVLTPVLLHVVGCPTVVAVGTGLLTVLFSGAYGAFVYGLAGRVEFMAMVVMLVD